VLDEVPLNGAQYSRVLNDAGTLSGNIALDGKSALRTAQLISDAEPGAINMVVARGDAYVWTGLLTGHGAYDSDTGVLPIVAAEWFSYCDRRYYVSGSLNSPPTTITGDIASLASNFVTGLFSDGGPTISAVVQTSGVSTTMEFAWYEQHKLSDLITSLASMVPGFDFSFDAAKDANGDPTINLVISSPRRGARAFTTGIVFDYPGGNVLKYSANKEVGRFATDVIATGGGSGDSLLVARSQAPLSGYVKQTMVVNNKDLSAQDQVNSFSAATLAAYGSQPPTILGLTVRGDSFFSQGMTTGDDFLLSVAPGDPYFPNGTNQYLRCIGYVVTPGDGEQQPEQVEVIVGATV